MASMQESIASLKAGETYTVPKGTYHTHQTINVAGTAKKPIIIDGSNAVLDGQGKSGTLLTIGAKAAHVIVKGFTLKNLKGNNACGIRILAGAHNITMKDMSIKNIKVPMPLKSDVCANAILAYADGKNPIKEISIIGGTVEDIESGWSEAVSFSGYCRNITVDGLAVRDIGNIGIDICRCPDNPNPAHRFPDVVEIKNCNVADCHNVTYDKGSAAGIYVDGARNVTIENNTVSHCDHGIEIGDETAEKDITKRSYATEDNCVFENKIYDCPIALMVGGYEPDRGWVYSTVLFGNKVKGASTAVLLSKVNGVNITYNRLEARAAERIVAYDFSVKNAKKYTKEVYRSGNITVIK